MHNQEYEARVREALSTAMKMTLEKRLPYEVAQDIAQEAVIQQADVLQEDGWKERLCSATFEIIKRAVKEHKKECNMKHELKEGGWPRHGCEESRLCVREVAPQAMSDKQWQVCHKIYWHRLTQEQIGIALLITQQAVSELHIRGLQEMKVALRRLGIDRGNWRKWYYEGV